MPTSRLLKTLAGLGLFSLLVAFSNARADQVPATPAKISFDAQIAPLLVRRCLSCHNATAKKGGLDLSQKNTAKAGGNR